MTLEDKLRCSITPATSREVPPWWEDLYAAARNSCTFLSPAWLQTWIEIYGSDFQAWWVQWLHGDDTVGGCLLARQCVYKSIFPLRTLFLNGGGTAASRTPSIEYNDILHVEGSQDAITTDLARLLRRLRWDRFQIAGHADESIVRQLASRLPVAAVDTELKPARFVDLRTRGAVPYEDTLTGKIGNHIRRNRRLFEEQAGTMAITVARSLEQALEYFAELCRLSNKRWEGAAKPGTFTSPTIVEFHRRLIARLWPRGAVDLVRVGNERAVVGFLYNLVHKRKVDVFQTGFTYQWDSRLSPGMLTHALAIEHYRQRGFEEYDLLAGDSLYKRSLAKGERPLYWTTLYSRRPYPSALVAMRGLKRRVDAMAARLRDSTQS